MVTVAFNTRGKGEVLMLHNILCLMVIFQMGMRFAIGVMLDAV